MTSNPQPLNTLDKPVNDRNLKKSWVPTLLIGIAVVYLGLVLYIPAVNVFYQAFRLGTGAFFENLTKLINNISKGPLK